tara:strand:- start:349 stop:1014 length:666 start_codon:yes stop_codon:yes gene_type:complete
MRISINFISNLVIGFCLLIAGCAQPVSDNPGLTKFSEYTFITSNQTSLICEYSGTHTTIRRRGIPHFINLSILKMPIKVKCSKENYWDKVIVLTPIRTFDLLDRLALRQNVTAQNSNYNRASVGPLSGLPRKLHIVLRKNSFKSTEERDIYYAEEAKFTRENWDAVASKINKNCQMKESNNVEPSLNIDYAACQKAREQIQKLLRDDLTRLEVERRGSLIE